MLAAVVRKTVLFHVPALFVLVQVQPRPYHETSISTILAIRVFVVVKLIF